MGTKDKPITVDYRPQEFSLAKFREVFRELFYNRPLPDRKVSLYFGTKEARDQFEIYMMGEIKKDLEKSKTLPTFGEINSKDKQ